MLCLCVRSGVTLYLDVYFLAYVPERMCENVLKCHVGAHEDVNTSDHVPITVDIDIRMLPRLLIPVRDEGRIRWDKWDGVQRTQLYQIPLGQQLEGVLNAIAHSDGTEGDIERIFDKLIKSLHGAAKAVPRSHFKRNLKPYWSEELRWLKKDKMFWFRRWKEEGRTLDADDPVRQRMKASKKLFAKRLRVISKQYEEDEIAKAANLAEIDMDSFWRVFKRMKGTGGKGVHAIKTPQGMAVYEIGEILEVWRVHFDALSTPKQEDRFDNAHFNRVTQAVKAWAREGDTSEFMIQPLTSGEVERAIQKLNQGKAPGYDGITAEHIKFGGHPVAQVLCSLLNLCIAGEYVPNNFRKGIQVPLYKGKNMCSLKPDNYRGITLLSTFNKLFEVVIWGRISAWWFEERIVSDLQGAGRKGSLCIHTALTLQETIAKEREGHRNVFVAYYDVSKAYDSVWIDGLFYQLHEMGIKDSLWRILYKSYQNFRCCVRIGNDLSEWYPMECGIHQGGFLSLVKYTAFITSLLASLEKSQLCSVIYRIPTSPVGYADYLAACTRSKRKMDGVMDRVFTHSCKWRYSFNAGKSAVLIFGETARERRIGVENRVFKLGREKVKEKLYYDHVGVKTCVLGDTQVRTEEKVVKAKKTLNMATALGIKKGGLNMGTCNLIYWTVVMPTLCFGSEIWVIKEKDILQLRAFQRYAARRLQRFHPRSVNSTCFACLGWMDIVTFIKARKIIFLRSILVMQNHTPIRRVLIERVNEFREGMVNEFDSPIIQILEYCVEFNVIEEVTRMINQGVMSKGKWKEMIWARAWNIEEGSREVERVENRFLDLISMTMNRPSYSIWWTITDFSRQYIKQ